MLLSAWLVALLVALSEAPVWGWGSRKVIGLLVAAVVLRVAWSYSEQRAATPLIDMKMMRLPAVWTNNLVALLVGVGMYGVFAFLPEFVQTPTSAGYGFGASITESGLILLPSAVTMFFVGLYAGRLALAVRRQERRDHRLPGRRRVDGAARLRPRRQVGALPRHAIMGVGFGLAFAAMSSLIVAAVPPEQTGVASGMNANIRTIGGSIGAALMASIVTSQLEPGGLPKEIGYTIGFAVLAAALLVGRDRGHRRSRPGGRSAPIPTTSPSTPNWRSWPPAPSSATSPNDRRCDRRGRPSIAARRGAQPAARPRRRPRGIGRARHRRDDGTHRARAPASGSAPSTGTSPTKDALIDELVRLILDELIGAARTALDRADGAGLEEFLRDLGGLFVEHRGYAHLLVGRRRPHAAPKCCASTSASCSSRPAAGRIGAEIASATS